MRDLTAEKVIIIGAGIGGLCCAIDLAGAGFDVTVVERAASCGGKMRQIPLPSGPADAGPTVLTLRWVFEQLFEDAGACFAQAVTLKPLDILARHSWSDDSRLDLFADPARTAEAIGLWGGTAEAKGYLAFHKAAQGVFESLKGPFLTAEKTGPVGLAGRFGWQEAGALLRLRPFETLWGALGDYFKDPRLRQLFGRYATYCGSSPFQAPATLMLVAHVEQAGVWRVDGGMARLAQALEALARAKGVTFRLGAAAQTLHVENGRPSGVDLAGGERLEACAVVVNADPAALRIGAFGKAAARGVPARSQPRSLSAITWALEAPAAGADLVHHNVIFSADYRAEFVDIFRRNRPPVDPTIYVCAQDRGDEGPGRTGPERFLVLINAPPTGDQSPLPPEELSRCESQVFERLRRLGLSPATAESSAIRTTPQDFNGLFPASGGGLYGMATHGWNAAFQRPGARTRIPGLYLAGGGTHPGAGVPMAALSGRLAARCLIGDRTSAPGSRRAATAGGMWTPKAKTANTPSS
jgi:1-hydroxycarotenoid 3,4-desaturase